MKLKQSLIVVLVVCALAAVLPVAGYAADEAEDWTIYFRPGVRVSNHDRVMGYFDFLVPLSFTDKSVLFFNPRANFDNNRNVEWNVGIGYRHLLANDKLILGGNLFYDGRRSYTHNSFHQIGLGAEVLSEWVSGRINGYISLSDAQETDRWHEYYFGSTSLNYSRAYSLEEPMSGLDYEVGFKIPGLSNYVETWVYGGGYNYFSDYTDNMAGWSTRIEVIPTDFLKADFSVRDDNLRGTEYAGEVVVEVPFSIENLVAGKNPFVGMGSRFGGSRTMKERLYEQVRRDVDITINTKSYTHANTPEGTLPGGTGGTTPTGVVVEGIIYVDSSNTNPSPDGSLENPYTTIADAVAAVTSTRNTIYVFPGNGPYSEAVVLTADTNLWGSGCDPFGMGLSGTSVVEAPATNPGFSFPGSSYYEPVIQAWGSLSDNTGTVLINVNIMGMTVDGNGRLGASSSDRQVGIVYRNVVGSIIDCNVVNMGYSPTFDRSWSIMVFGGSNVSILGNALDGYGKGGIVVNGDPNHTSYATPYALIEGNTITGPPYGLTNICANGIQIGWGATGIVRNNIITSHKSASIWGACGILIQSSPNVLVEGNTVTDADNGIVSGGYYGYGISYSTGTIIRNNTVSGNGNGILVDYGSINTLVEGNTITGNDCGIHVGSSNTAADHPFPSNTDIHGNLIYDNTTGLFVETVGGQEIVDATNNWWGDASGPSGAGTGTGDSVSTNVLFNPWLTTQPNP